MMPQVADCDVLIVRLLNTPISRFKTENFVAEIYQWVRNVFMESLPENSEISIVFEDMLTELEIEAIIVSFF
jgi:hypothetical protein